MKDFQIRMLSILTVFSLMVIATSIPNVLAEGTISPDIKTASSQDLFGIRSGSLLGTGLYGFSPWYTGWGFGGLGYGLGYGLCYGLTGYGISPRLAWY